MTSDAEVTGLRHASEAFGEIVHCLHLLDTSGWIDLDLSMAQFKTFMLVAASGGLSGRELSQRLGICQSAVTPLVDRLVQHGYVRREEDTADRRISWARPTADGMALFERVIAGGRQQLEEILLTLSPADLDLVANALAMLREAAAGKLAHARKKGTQ